MKYKLIRSKRKTLTISISGGEVTVKAPKSSSIEYIESFVAQKQSWIDKKLAEYDKKVGVLGDVMAYKNVMFGGAICPIEVTSAVKKIRYEGGKLLVPDKYEDESAKRRAIASWYKKTAEGFLSHTLEALSIKTGLGYKSFSLTNARTKWGSCDGSCNIRLNWRLLMLSDELTEYVIIHELCHTVHHDHSPAFWEEVKKHCAAVPKKKKLLKTYSLLTTLYR